MKQTKKWLALVLTFALALSLALPAAAVNWDEFRIVTQPQSMTVAYGESATLTIEVNVPDGAQVVYDWRRVSTPNSFDTVMSKSTEPTLTVNFIEDRKADGFIDWLGIADDKAAIAMSGDSEEYYCNVICREEDEDDNTIESRTLRSETVTVTMEKGNIWQQALGWIGFPLIVGAQMLAPITWLTAFFAVPFIPIIYPICVIIVAIGMLKNAAE